MVRVCREVISSPSGEDGSPGPDFGNPHVIAKIYRGRSSSQEFYWHFQEAADGTVP